MQDKSEIMIRINYLQSQSPAGAATLYTDLKSAVEAYLTRDGNFELQVNKTLDKVIAVSFHRGLLYGQMGLIPEFAKQELTDKPDGYEDIRTLFKGGEVFDEILTTELQTLLIAFQTVSTSASGNGNMTFEWHNEIIEDWIQRLQEAVENEISGLKAIMSYSANQSYGVEYALLFEELDRTTKRHDVKYYAKDIFYNKGYGWLIETFNLKVYKPSYMSELAEWTEANGE